MKLCQLNNFHLCSDMESGKTLQFYRFLEQNSFDFGSTQFFTDSYRFTSFTGVLT